MNTSNNFISFDFKAKQFDDLYKNHRNSSFRFMRQMIDDIDEIMDVYQEAVIVLYQKSRNPEFRLTCSVQTYINSICRNQILKKFPNSRKLVRTDEFEEEITDWFEEYDEQKEIKLSILESALKEMESAKGPCFGLLRGFYFLRMSMDDLARSFNFANAESAKNQKARCQKKLKEMVLTKYSAT
jgi:RNA polymerase sigma factor (sigma-70 family)